MSNKIISVETTSEVVGGFALESIPKAACVTPTLFTFRKQGALSLRKNFSWNLAGNIVYAACQWGMLIVLAKLTNPEMVGHFALGLAVTAPIIMLCNMQLRGVQATDVREEYQFGNYLCLRIITTLLALIIIAVVSFCGKYPLQAAMIILSVGLSKAIESISDIYYGFIQRHERMDRIAKSRMIKGPLSLLVLVMVVYVTGNVLWGGVGLALSWTLILIVYDMPSANLIMKETSESTHGSHLPLQSLMPKFNLRLLLRLAWLAMPLGFAMGLVSLKPNIPQYFIEHYWGVGDLGIFAALSYLIVAGHTVVVAMGQSATPQLANYYAAGDHLGYRRLLIRLLLMGFGLGAGGICVALLGGGPLLLLLYGPEYAVCSDVFVWLMGSGALAFMASFLGYGMIAARYFRVQMPLFIIVTSVTGIAAWLLIPCKGLVGAAIALAVGSLIQGIGSGLVILNALKAPKVP